MILEYHVENFLCIKDVDIKTDKNVIIITGQNGQGKSSVIEGIFSLLTGKLPEKPIRDGEESALIEIETDKYYITKKITKKSSTLTIKDKDDPNGKPLPKPQTILNDALGSFSMDPMTFLNKDDMSRREILLDIAGLDFSEIDGKYKTAYDERRDIGRDTKKAEAHVSTLGKESDFKDFPIEPINVSELSKTIEGLKTEIKINADILDEITENEERVESLKEEIKALEEKNQSLDKAFIGLQEFEVLSIDRDGFQDDLGQADGQNKKYYALQEFRKASDEHADLHVKYCELDQEVKDLENEKKEMILFADLPLEGLGVDEKGVTYNDIPFNQLSSAEKIRVSVSLAMASDPELRVLRIIDGSLLDDNSMDIVEELADENGFQVWIERVGNDPEAGIMIEEGEVKDPSSDKPIKRRV